jgi:hypothetical protein
MWGAEIAVPGITNAKRGSSLVEEFNERNFSVMHNSQMTLRFVPQSSLQTRLLTATKGHQSVSCN